MVNLIDRLSEQEITSLAEHIAKKETKDFVLLLRNEYNIEPALDVIETWIRISGHPYRHEVSETPDIHMLYSMIWTGTGLFIWQSYIELCLKNLN